MKASENAYKIIKEYESLRLKTYLCPAGIRTIGYGHTGTDVMLGMEINEELANAYLKLDVAATENAINKLLKTQVTQNQFDALVSFTFNVGAGNLQNSTLLKKINTGNHADVANEFLKWNKARKDGKLVELPGLTKRRNQEKQLFEKQQ